MKDPSEYLLEKNLMIRASAGSGKTYQLSNRIIGYVGGHHIDPKNLVALTFTRKAAGEFADAILTKLATAATDPQEAAQLNKNIGIDLDPTDTLKRIIHALPELQLGTMDSFFARVIRSFQYELGITGGQFELIQGPRRDQAVADILAHMLGNAISGQQADDFLHAFQRATSGRSAKNITTSLNHFIDVWAQHWRAGRRCDPGHFVDDPTTLPGPDTWESEKHQLVAKLRRTTEQVEWTDKRQPDAWEKFCTAIESHTIGSGTITSGASIFKIVSTWISDPSQPLELKLYKPFEIDPVATQTLEKIFSLLTRAELHSAITRSHATLELVAQFDFQCDRQLRRRGLLGFDDIKNLMGQWSKSEDARLSREAIDFRLDAIYHHWLLDEFQDTSGEEWLGLSPLIDEAVSKPDGSLFIVGDTKQAIYGWRGGDVKLFNQIRDHYGEGLKVEPMPLSWRSGKNVLELVNKICGDHQAVSEIFGPEIAGRWEWEDHQPAKTDLTGEARVEVVTGKSEDRLERVVTLLHELGIGQKDLTCGILTRTNKQTQAIAQRLRSEGFDVIEEGMRHPTQDDPVGTALAQFIAWLADPRDHFARRVVAMSPLESQLSERFDGHDARAWESLLTEAATSGFATMLEHLIEPLWHDLGDFGQRRADDIISALAAFDTTGGSGARHAKRWIHDLQIPQSPGTGAIQVMTVHKSKGLGFDVVILPELEDSKVPNLRNFEVATSKDWALQPPAEWVRQCFPPLVEAETKWTDDQQYEAMCVLYVALTRAKRGLYLIVSKQNRSSPNASPVSLIHEILDINEEGPAFQSGDPSWLDSLPPRHEDTPIPTPELPSPQPKRQRTTPSSSKVDTTSDTETPSPSTGGQRFGSEVHRVLESVGWTDDQPPSLPDNEAGQVVAQLLREPAILPYFTRDNRHAQLLREQPFEVILNNQWVSGIIDRLHLIDNATQIEIIDFKTDAVSDETTLIDRYRSQMDLYRRAVATIYPDAQITCHLLSTRLKRGLLV